MSKGLEAFKYIFDIIPMPDVDKETRQKIYCTMDDIEQDLKRLEQLEKALEIIKNKCAANTNIWLVVCTRTYEDYESFVENKDHKLVRLEHNILAQQEYELLKEVLEDE